MGLTIEQRSELLAVFTECRWELKARREGVFDVVLVSGGYVQHRGASTGEQPFTTVLSEIKIKSNASKSDLLTEIQKSGRVLARSI
jgi:hypothetical protein